LPARPSRPRDSHSRFRRFLAEHGLRLTTERRRLLEIVLDDARAADADELLARARRAGVSVSRATVYRTLDLLVKSGLVRLAQRPLDGRSARYERVKGSPRHGRLVCLACGRIERLPGDAWKREPDASCTRAGFTPQYHYLEVFGVCRRCARAAGSGERA